MKRLIAAAAAAACVALAAPAGAVDVPITAQVLSGSRSITSAGLTLADPGVLPGAGLSGGLAVVVIEAAAEGDADWSVTAELCRPSAADPLVPDCGTRAMVNALDSTKTLPASAVSISGATTVPVVLPTLLDSAVTTLGGTADLSAVRTLFRNTGETPGTVYTGTYTHASTVTITPPPNSAAGVYAGYVVVTLVE